MNLEQDIINSVHGSIREAITKTLSGYSSPLEPLIKTTVEKHSLSISALLDDSIQAALSGCFAEELRASCTRKLAKALIAKMEGEIEKKATELRSNPTFRARLTLAIDDLIRSITP